MIENNESVLPKYHRIIKFIIDYIQEKGIEEGESLPTESEIMNLFITSREPVRQAYKILEDEGVIYKVRGKGSFLKKLPEKKKSKVLCVISPYGDRDIYKGIIRGINDYAKSKEYDILLLNSNFSQKNEIDLLRFIRDKDISGLIMEPMMSAVIDMSSTIVRMLNELQMPVVIINCIVPDLNSSTVTIDDEKYGYMATQYLIAHNHTRIAFISNSECTAAKLRTKGYLRALEDHGIFNCEDYLMIYATKQIIGKRHPATIKTKQLLEMDPPPTAIFYFDDHDAVIGMKEILAEGLSIPEDVSVIGFDDAGHAMRSPVPLTTVVHPKDRMGSIAAQILIEEIEGNHSVAKKIIYLDTEIVERKSVKMLIK